MVFPTLNGMVMAVHGLTCMYSVWDIKQSTGYDGKLVEAMWEKYGIPNSIQWAHFVQALAYIHLYPTRRQVPSLKPLQPVQGS